MVRIKPLEEFHAETSYKWRNNPDIWQYTFNRPDRIITPEIEREWLKKVLKNSDEKRFAIYFFDKYVGNIYLTSITNSTAYYGIFLGDLNYTGKGIAGEASLQILRYAKEQLSLSKVFLRVKKLNVGAFKLYTKLGFKVIEEIEDYYKMEIDLATLT